MQRVTEYGVVLFFTASLAAALDRLMCALEHRQAPLSMRSIAASVVAMAVMLIFIDLRSWIDDRRRRREASGEERRGGLVAALARGP